jgi:hypothetical protein
MRNKKTFLLAALAVVAGVFCSNSAYALPQNYKEKDAGKSEELQAKKSVSRAFDIRKNTVSNISFYTSNYGVFGYDVERNTGGGFWPRGSFNQYIFGGGIWFGAKKRNKDGAFNSMAVVSYNPRGADSWLIPGRYHEPNGDINPYVDENNIYKYRTFMSTDFSRSTGKSLNTSEEKEAGNIWPIWDTDPQAEGYYLGYDRYFGRYVNDPELRNTTKYPKGPAFISEEDIFSTFKDTDLSRYAMGPAAAKQKGYPLYTQFEQMIYSWGFGEYKDFIFIKYDIVNMSNDTLRDCWMSPMMDVDIARAPFTARGADNDRCKYYRPAGWETNKGYKDTLNLALQWSQTTLNTDEYGKGFGYLGYDFLESPSVYKAVDTMKIVDEQGIEKTVAWMWGGPKQQLLAGEINPITKLPVSADTVIFTKKVMFEPALEGFVRKDQRYYDVKEQLGLVSFRNWNISEDVITAEQIYSFMNEVNETGYRRDGDLQAGDKRFMMSTGPFSMLPKDTVRVVVGIILANPATKQEPDGSLEDLANLVKRDIFAQKVYDNNFRAPMPPSNSFFLGHKSANNSIEVFWDSTAEVALDKEEEGLDFMGYSLYRARNPYQDTFSVNEISATNEYPKGRGPFAWKLLKTWTLPLPFKKSSYKAGNVENPNYPSIDEIQIAGLNRDANTNVIDTFSITIMRSPVGMTVISPTMLELYQNKDKYKFKTPVIENFVSSEANEPWGKYFAQDWTPACANFQMNPLHPNWVTEPFMRKHVYGKINLNTSVLSYNPLFWKRVTAPAKALCYIVAQDGKTRTGVQLEDYTPTMINDTNFTKRLIERYNPKDTIQAKASQSIITAYTDVINLWYSVRPMEMNGTVSYVYDKMVPLFNSDTTSWENIFKNSEWLTEVTDSLYKYIKNGSATVSFYSDLDTKTAREDIILPYMNKITNNRRYFDVGDDNQNGVVDLNDNSTATEKIFNNVDYYYKLEAFDEGDYNQPTPRKQNDGSVGRTNNIKAFAAAGRPTDDAHFEIVHEDSDLLGSLRNFKFFPIDNEKVNQVLAGRVFELEFQPETQIYTLSIPGKDKKTKSFGVYSPKMIIRDTTTKEILFEGSTNFEQFSRGVERYQDMFTENGFSIVMADSVVRDTNNNTEITYGTDTSMAKFDRLGSFNSGKFNREGNPYSSNFKNGYGYMFGFSFDFAIEQRGGIYRPGKATKVKTNAVTPINSYYTANYDPTSPSSDNVERDCFFPGAQYVDFKPYGSNRLTTFPDDKPPVLYSYANMYPVTATFNNGPGDYLVTFKEPGVESMTLTYGQKNPRTNTFNVPYLRYDVVNKYSFKKVYADGVEKEIKYGNPLTFMQLPDSMRTGGFLLANSGNLLKNLEYYIDFPHPKSLKSDAYNFIGKFNSFAVGYVNLRKTGMPQGKDKKEAIAIKEGAQFKESFANLIGEQGKYYKTAINGADTLDFVNVLNIAGAMYFFDYANIGCFEGNSINLWDRTEDYVFNGPDFENGDQVMLQTNGGAFGFPMPKAKVIFKVNSVEPKNNDYKEEQLDKIVVAPNPYYITHEAQTSAYDSRIYFAKLPPTCTIEIYTVSGDLVQTIKHDEVNNNGYASSNTSIDVWDLYSSNKQRVQSQTFVAYITTPNGEKTLRKFSVIVGSARLITE